METYTLADVQKHSRQGDIWIIHDRKVYDVSEFSKRHPGGENILLEHARELNANVTQVMRDRHPHKHSPTAYKILRQYRIGQIDLDENKNSLATGPISPRIDGYSQRSKTAESLEAGGMFNWTKDSLIDWTKPVLWQVGSLGGDYWQWVHSPIDRTSLRLFKSDFCEYFSNTPWYIVPIVWVPVVLVLLYCAISGFNDQATAPLVRILPDLRVSVSSVPLLFLLGFLMWTLIEYILHRWLFHLKPPAESPALITWHFILHGQHHKVPFNQYRLVFPPVPAAGIALCFAALYSAVFPVPVMQCMLAGGLLGYVSYDLTHYYLHHGSPTRGSYFHRLRKYHVRHHFENQKKGFGISSKLWDYPFDTLLE